MTKNEITTINDIYKPSTIVDKLEKLVDRVVEKEDLKSDDIHSAVACVDAINNLLKTHIEQQRLHMEMAKIEKILKP